MLSNIYIYNYFYHTHPFSTPKTLYNLYQNFGTDNPPNIGTWIFGQQTQTKQNGKVFQLLEMYHIDDRWRTCNKHTASLTQFHGCKKPPNIFRGNLNFWSSANCTSSFPLHVKYAMVLQRLLIIFIV